MDKLTTMKGKTMNENTNNPELALFNQLAAYFASKGLTTTITEEGARNELTLSIYNTKEEKRGEFIYMTRDDEPRLVVSGDIEYTSIHLQPLFPWQEDE